MTLPNEVLLALRPTHSPPVRQLVEQAGVDVSGWAVDKNGEEILNPNTNTYKNSQWTFGGSGAPIVVCVWWKDLAVKGDHLVHEGSSKGYSRDLGNALAAPDRTSSEAQRLRGKIVKAHAFDRAVYEARSKQLPIRMVVLDGETPDEEDSAQVSARASKRLLDESSWYAHAYDPFSGNYELVRGVPSAHAPPPDPFGGAEDPAEDPAFQQFLTDAPLSETEKDALIKARVGQGWFRDALVKRWRGCAVTNCADPALLIASHILPWRLCTTRVERLGVSNGLLLAPHIDKAFDIGLISFDDAFRILISEKMRKADEIALNIHPGMTLKSRDHSDIRPFLKRHREEIFQAPARVLTTR